MNLLLFELGTLRILANKDKKETWEKFNDKLNEYHKKYGDLNILDINDLNKIYLELVDLSVGERIEKFNLKPDRADVIIPAGKIFIKASSILKSDHIIVPMIGLSDGIVDELIENNINVI